MEEIKIPELLCAYFGGLGYTLIPEAWRDGYPSVWLSGGITVVSEYVNGSRLTEVPFEIRLRIPGESVKDRLDAVEFFRKIAEAAKRKKADSSGDFTLRVTSGAVKSAIYDSGEEEYRASYAVRYRESAEQN